MDAGDIANNFLTYERRLASFRAKKRASNAGARASKAPQWPHKTLSAETLAKAGFFFFPSPENPDNVACFLCHKSLAGWEDNDRPWEEHLRHSPDCGWAINMAVEAGDEATVEADPKSTAMLAARKMTFGSRWPYEKKRGWKCKTKQLVDAGWIYSPTEESEDMAVCPQCGLGLSGWEPSDNPWDEHFKRKPDCVFFALVAHHQSTKKGARGKGARTSKASRLSVQSTATAASTYDMPSMSELTAEMDDSVVATTGVPGGPGTGRKGGRGRKAAAPKGRKPRAKKEETSESMDDSALPPSPPPPAPPPAKAGRGRKRASDAMNEFTLVMDGPAAKRARMRGSSPAESRALATHDEEKMSEGELAAESRSPHACKHNRSMSALSTASKASLRAPGAYPEDDEHMGQLEEDVIRDDEEPATASRSFHAMFDPSPAPFDEDELDEELRELQRVMAEEVEAKTAVPVEAEAGIEEAEEKLLVPKKGRKAGPRKTSKQIAKESKTPELALPPDEDSKWHEPSAADLGPPMQLEANGLEESWAHDVSNTSTGTVVKGKKRGRPPKKTKSNSGGSVAERSEPSLVEEVVVEEQEQAPEDLAAAEGEEPGLAGSEMTEPDMHEEHTEPDAFDAPRIAEEPDEHEDLEEPEEPEDPEEPEEAEKLEEPEEPEEAGEPEELEGAEGAAEPQVDPQTAAMDVNTESPSPVRQPAPRRQGLPSQAQLSSGTPSPSKRSRNPPSSIPRSVAMPSTPIRNPVAPSPAPSARQPILSPSQSPQSSDAENKPPSARAAPAATPAPAFASLTATAKRVMMLPPPPPPLAAAAVAATPVRNMSPTKLGRSVLRGGARTAGTPWRSVDIDAVFDVVEEWRQVGEGEGEGGKDDEARAGGYRGENGVDHGGEDGEVNSDGESDARGVKARREWKSEFIRDGDLTTPERNMTVDEWIQYNARAAEGRLRRECEGLVSRFESEGGRAMRVLEGLVVEN